MSENKVENRVVVTDDTGEVSREKTEDEIVKENQEFEKSLKVNSELDPDILKKLKQKKEETVKAVSSRDRSLYFGVVGLGQAGGRISSLFYTMGYEAVAFNTATQDLEYVELPKNRKIHLPFALGGCGKDLDNGQMAIEQNAELILKQANNFFNENHEMILLAVSGGGGTGSGGAESMISLLSSLGKPVGVIYVLPSDTEDSLSKHNSVITLSKLAKMSSADVITTLMVVDNARIDVIYPNLPKSEFWKVANNVIVEPLHLFNHLSSMPTPHDSLDPTDFVKVFSGGDCAIYGMIQVKDFEETTALAEAILSQLDDSLLASDFNLKEARMGGFMIAGHPNCLKRLVATNISYASHMISEATNHAQLVSGVYELEDMSEEEGIRIYTLFSGLGLPAKRIEDLKTQAEVSMEIAKEKEDGRSARMTIDYGGSSNTVVQSKDIHRMIKQKNSAFNRITQSANKHVKDRRKR